MTTSVEPEGAPRSPRGRRLLLVTATLIAATAFIIVGACALDQNEPQAADTTSFTDSTPTPYVADASFVLQDYGTLDAEATQFWQDLTLDHVVSLGLPFSRYNRYYTRFFLKQGETAEILMEANVPLGASLGAGIEGISVMMLPGSAPYGESHAHAYLPSTETATGGYFERLERMGGNWQIGWAVTALNSDYYWLILTNQARQDAWCHFTVNVPAG